MIYYCKIVVLLFLHQKQKVFVMLDAELLQMERMLVSIYTMVYQDIQQIGSLILKKTMMVIG